MPGEPAKRARAIALLVAGVTLFAISDGVSKFLTESCSIMQVVWARYAFAVPVVLASVRIGTWSSLLRSARPALQLGRGLLLALTNVVAVLGLGLLPLADFVILTVPHTPATEGLMHRARFQRMKRTGYFINIGRGMTTRLHDLVAALRAGEIAGAALDVFEQEPLPADHPLWTLPNVLITPHTAGHGPYLDDRRFEILLDNGRRFLAGQPLRNVVDKAGWF